MGAFKTITLLLIGAGALVMFSSAWLTRGILVRLSASRHRRTWRLLSGLMVLFLGGYMAAGILIFFDFTEPLLLLTGGVFFFGALFVLLVVRAGDLTLREDQEIKSDLLARGEAVERELKAVDRERETTEARYRLLVENCGMPILYLGLDGTLFFVNEDGAKLFNKTPNQMVGSYLTDLFSDTPRRFRAALRRIMGHRDGTVFEVEVNLPGGRAWYLAVCRPIFSNLGDPVAVQIVAQDVTDRHIAEQAIREQKEIYDQVLNNMSFDLVLFDSQKRYEFINPRAIEDSDLRVRMLGQSYFDYVRSMGWDSEIARERNRSLDQVFDRKRELRYEEKKTGPDGETRHILRVLTPIFDRAGRVVKIVGQGIDITEQKLVQSEMAAARDLAESASRAKSEFLTNMSHEIRTPLNAVLGMAELLSESDLSADQRRFVGIARKAGDHLLLLINDVLDLARIESGRFEIDSVPFDPRELIRGVTEAFALQAQEKNLAFETELASDLPPSLRGDPVRLRQILVNLVGNAVKFTEQGFVRVEVRLQESSERSAELEFDVTDSGPGIPPAVYEQIFQPFAQADSSMTRRFGGTGLGLAISRRLAELLGGEIELESEPGTGSRFRLALPFARARSDEIPSPPGTENPLDPGHVPRLRVLLVEDHPDNQALIQAYLKKTPCQLRLAANGQEALDLFRSEDFDLVLLDMQMPVMDGYTAAGRMRDFERETRRPRTPIIALTAHALKEEEEKCLRAGCDRHLAKPIEKSVLLGVLAGTSVKSD